MKMGNPGGKTPGLFFSDHSQETNRPLLAIASGLPVSSIPKKGLFADLDLVPED
jgi:hypothetical protein